MLIKCLAIAIGLSFAPAAYSQTNAVEASKPALAPVQPPRPNPYDTTGIPDSVRAIVTEAIDSAQASQAVADTMDAVKRDSGAEAPTSAPAVVRGDSAEASVPADSSAAFKAALRGEKGDVDRDLRDRRLFKDRALVAKEYGFGILGSVVAGALGFYIGSGIETAIVGNSKAHKGTLAFTGIRYDNFQGAFWGGSTGLVLGSAFTTYFVGQTDEENGGLLATLAGTAAAAGGAFYIAHLMGVNDDIDWKPFIPLVAIPSIGGTIGFNVSRWFNDRKRESIVGEGVSLHLHAPRLSWGRTQDGDRLDIHALNLTF